MDISIANRQQKKDVHMTEIVGVYMMINAMGKITSYVTLTTNTKILQLAVAFMKN